MLMQSLKVWNKEVFGCVEEKKKRLLEEIKHWDCMEENRCLSQVERSLRDLAKQEYANVVDLEEIKWKQKAKFNG